MPRDLTTGACRGVGDGIANMRGYPGRDVSSCALSLS